MATIDPAADLLGIYSASLAQHAEATVYHAVKSVLDMSGGVLAYNPTTGKITITPTAASIGTLTAGTGLLGGGAMSGNVTVTLATATSAEALAGSRTDVAITPATLKDVTDAVTTAILGAAPATLDTLKEIADAINNDAAIAATLTAQIAGKASSSTQVIAGAGLTGGGALTANVTVNVDYATAAEIAAGVSAVKSINPAGLASALPSLVTASTGLKIVATGAVLDVRSTLGDGTRPVLTA